MLDTQLFLDKQLSTQLRENVRFRKGCRVRNSFWGCSLPKMRFGDKDAYRESWKGIDRGISTIYIYI